MNPAQDQEARSIVAEIKESGDMWEAIAKLIQARDNAIQERDNLERKVEVLKDALHIDQTGLAAAMAEIEKISSGFAWVANGRGPYEWDDNEYRAEMKRMVDAINQKCVTALRESGDRSHIHCCGE